MYSDIFRMQERCSSLFHFQIYHMILYARPKAVGPDQCMNEFYQRLNCGKMSKYDITRDFLQINIIDYFGVEKRTIHVSNH